MSEQDAHATCEDAGLEWEPARADYFKCSGTPVGIGMAASSMVGFCAGDLCAVQISTVPEDRSTWTRQFGKFKDALSAKYGSPTQLEATLPNYCTGSRASDCLDDGSLKASALWEWKTGEKLQLFMGKPQDGKPLIRLVYRVPVKAADGL